MAKGTRVTAARRPPGSPDNPDNPANPVDAVLAIDDLWLRRGERAVLTGLTLDVCRGELVALMGPSGSGKTTTLRAVVGLERFQAGQIRVDAVRLQGGVTPDKATLAALGRKVGMVFQFHCLFEHLTAIQNICLAPVHAHGVAPDAAQRRAIELMTTFGVDHRAQALPRQLSGGEAQRVAIARALAVDPPVLLMDEPTASLDPLRRSELGALLRGLVEQGRALVVATHDEEFARDFATRVVRI
ncbi:MAG TPA: ATP-binding cassette domain-containing protein [Vicinamibacterales bacterium]|jgi:ABC-type polar amino acid transport system ATPase subunit|nr:ATP-binding cassette domain-containing protein [Vicinamibacterales bacterium]